MKQSIPVRTQSKQSKHVPTPPARVQAPSTLSREKVGTADTSGDITVRSRKVSFTTATDREDTFLARIENDESIAAIAASLGADRSTLIKWLVSGAPRFRCAREAREAAAAVHIGHPASQYRGGGAEGPAVLGHAALSHSVSEFWNSSPACPASPSAAAADAPPALLQAPASGPAGPSGLTGHASELQTFGKRGSGQHKDPGDPLECAVASVAPLLKKHQESSR